MEKINELNLSIQNKIPARPSDEVVKEWGKRVDTLWERFLQLQREGKIPK
jgi:hypothetical protein